MRRLEVLFLGGPSTATARATVSLPIDATDTPLLLRNPHGLGRVWWRVSAAGEIPAAYYRVA